MTRNNKLDIAEFAVAMHLIQSRLKGTDIPLKLPETLTPTHLPHVNIPAVTQEEKAVYEKVFMWKNNEKTGYIDGKAAFLLSGPAVILLLLLLIIIIIIIIYLLITRKYQYIFSPARN